MSIETYIHTCAHCVKRTRYVSASDYSNARGALKHTRETFVLSFSLSLFLPACYIALLAGSFSASPLQALPSFPQAFFCRAHSAPRIREAELVYFRAASCKRPLKKLSFHAARAYTTLGSILPADAALLVFLLPYPNTCIFA